MTLLRRLNILKQLITDLLFVFVPNKLLVFSCTTNYGLKLENNNWGDDINKYFFESISKKKVYNIRNSLIYNYLPVKRYCCIGSIIGSRGSRRYVVWGSGVIMKNKPFYSRPLEIYSVRGPLSRQELLKNGFSCPEKYGDPALLVSRYYRKKVEISYEWGIIPHIVDENNPILKDFCHAHPEVLLISMQHYKDWHEIPDKIMSCRRIISSSLHGLIISDSYGVKNAWVKFSDNIIGGDFKFLDYFMSVGRVNEVPVMITHSLDLENIVINDRTSKAYNINFRSIFESCPFKDLLIDYEQLTPQSPQFD